MIIYNSGCSFTTEHSGVINEDQMYWYFLSKDLGAETVINDSKPGSSNNLIIQRVYRHVLSNLDCDTFYIINLTGTNRMDLEPSKSDRFEDVLTADAIIRHHWETNELVAYTQIIGLLAFLNSYKKNYYIINNSKAFEWNPSGPRKPFFDFVKDNPRILNLYQYSKYNFHLMHTGIKPWDYNLYGWNGHDGPAGHLAYYHKLKEIIQNRLS